jgi:hypothetical protein
LGAVECSPGHVGAGQNRDKDPAASWRRQSASAPFPAVAAPTAGAQGAQEAPRTPGSRPRGRAASKTRSAPAGTYRITRRLHRRDQKLARWRGLIAAIVQLRDQQPEMPKPNSATSSRGAVPSQLLPSTFRSVYSRPTDHRAACHDALPDCPWYVGSHPHDVEQLGRGRAEQFDEPPCRVTTAACRSRRWAPSEVGLENRSI